MNRPSPYLVPAGPGIYKLKKPGTSISLFLDVNQLAALKAAIESEGIE